MSKLWKAGAAALAAGMIALAAAGAAERTTVRAPSATANGKAAPGTMGPKSTGGRNKVAELSAHECRQVGGTVVTVTDDRCGASHRYCRMADTNAVCIDEAN